MGIDIYLKWKDMDKEAETRQITGYSTTAGNVGYLRESYHGGPYATRILVREAFEADNQQAQIPAAVLRERLTNVTEPTYNQNVGHAVTAALLNLMTGAMPEGTTSEPGIVMSDETRPMTVEEAVRLRCHRLYPDSEPDYADRVVQSFRDFVALAEKKEKETGEPCTIIASY